MADAVTTTDMEDFCAFADAMRAHGIRRMRIRGRDGADIEIELDMSDKFDALAKMPSREG